MHNVVTQVIINLDSSACNVTQFAQSEKMQVGFEVVLLASKLFPLLDNDSTTGVEFWRSARTTIAASRASYEKLAGVPGHKISHVNDDVATTPCKTMRCESSEQIFTCSACLLKM